jgi:hypothetical protein
MTQLLLFPHGLLVLYEPKIEQYKSNIEIKINTSYFEATPISLIKNKSKS